MTSKNKPMRGDLCVRPMVNPDPLQLSRAFEGFAVVLYLCWVYLFQVSPNRAWSGRSQVHARTRILSRQLQSIIVEIFKRVPFVALSLLLSVGETAEAFALVAEYQGSFQNRRESLPPDAVLRPGYTWRRYTSLRRHTGAQNHFQKRSGRVNT